MKKFLSAVCILSVIPSLGFATTLTSLKKEEIIKALSDKTITTIAAVHLNGQLIDNVFSGYLSKDGKFTGKFEKKPADAPQSDAGSWRASSDGLFCYKWDHWFENKEKCLSVYKVHNGLLFISPTVGFESVVIDKNIQSGNTLQQ